jgi:TrmH family RNA methyltransferase
VITSRSNSKVKYARSLQRRVTRHREKRFLVEGVRLVEEMNKTGQEPVFLFVTENVMADPRARSLVEWAGSWGREALTVSEDVMLAMTDTETPQGILAVADFPRWEDVDSELVLVLDGMRDPGNLGTILRTAEAAGVGLVFTMRGTADVYSPKVVRSGMGAHFRLPIVADNSWEEARSRVEEMQVLVAVPRGGRAYYEVNWTPPTALILGGEAEGPGARAQALASGAVTVPMKDGVESLNVAVAAGILLFEAARQRSAASSTSDN